MREFLEGKELKKNFLQYLVDVIEHYTPPLRPYHPKLPSNWYDVLFGNGRDSMWQGYGHFISAICNLTFRQSPGGFTGEHVQIYCRANPDPNVLYSIVTLNYDCVAESVVEFIKANYTCETTVDLRIAKLHGSVDSGVIVPPTWSKGVNKKIVPAWKQAYDYLTEANHLRVIGYSLPTADAYVKYLLKSAVTKAPHLKAIDVICLDNDGSAKRRYDEFMPFAYYRFRNLNVTDYLGRIKYNKLDPPMVNFEKLEEVHRSSFQ
jgi:hypothetical protein